MLLLRLVGYWGTFALRRRLLVGGGLDLLKTPFVCMAVIVDRVKELCWSSDRWRSRLSSRQCLCGLVNNWEVGHEVLAHVGFVVDD